MKDVFEEKIGLLEDYRWITIDECSENMGISLRTLYQYLKDGKIRGIKYKRRRMIDTISVIEYMLKQKFIGVQQIKNKEIKRILTSKEN